MNVVLQGLPETEMEPSKTTYPWFALQVRSGYERMVTAHLDGKGYERFLPLYKCRRRWSDRFKELELPLFPGYVFCRFNVLNRLPILVIPGVFSVVGMGKTAVPVEETEIAAIQAAVKSGLPSQPWPFLHIGDRVRVDYGALWGLEGILLGFKGRHRLVLSLTLLQRSVAVEIDDTWVRPIRQQPRAPTAPVGCHPLHRPITGYSGFDRVARRVVAETHSSRIP